MNEHVGLGVSVTSRAVIQESAAELDGWNRCWCRFDELGAADAKYSAIRMEKG